MVITKIICMMVFEVVISTKKGISKKLVLTILRFVYMLFKCLKKGISEKLV